MATFTQNPEMTNCYANGYILEGSYHVQFKQKG